MILSDLFPSEDLKTNDFVYICCMKTHLRTYICIIFASINLFTHAEVTWKHLEGLPCEETYSIAEDSRHFLWFGTRLGLIRYDGYQMQTHRNDTEHPTPSAHATYAAWHLIATDTSMPGLSLDLTHSTYKHNTHPHNIFAPAISSELYLQTAATTCGLAQDADYTSKREILKPSLFQHLRGKISSGLSRPKKSTYWLSPSMTEFTPLTHTHSKANMSKAARIYSPHR